MKNRKDEMKNKKNKKWVINFCNAFDFGRPIILNWIKNKNGIGAGQLYVAFIIYIY